MGEANRGVGEAYKFILCKEIADQWLLVCFQVNHGSVMITVDTSESRDQTSGTNVTKPHGVTDPPRCECIHLRICVKPTNVQLNV